MKTNTTLKTTTLAIIITLTGLIGWLTGNQLFSKPTFDGQRAYDNAAYQVSLGPRTIGSEAHRRAVDWMTTELDSAGWEVEIQETPFAQLSETGSAAFLIRNVVARRGEGEEWIILGAHYDSRDWADQDANTSLRRTPVPGANDGASGVAVLIELARALPRDLDKRIWLVFFDAEDNGHIPGFDWIMGSRAFAQRLQGKPDAVVIVDMIGDADLNIYLERNSDAQISAAIWEQAASLGYKQFIPAYKYSMIDDHTPFLEMGIPAVDIIDFDYPYWHTTADTPDKVSAESLKAVGETLLAWLLR